MPSRTRFGNVGAEMRPTRLLPGLVLVWLTLVGCSAGPPTALGPSEATAPTQTSQPTASPGTTAIPRTSAPPKVAGDSGVAGRTVIRGGCPPYPDTSSCPDQPVPARISITNVRGSTIVAAVSTDAQGRFRIALLPGRYVLQAANLTGGPRLVSTPMEVQVVLHRYTLLTVPFSSILEPGPGS